MQSRELDRLVHSFARYVAGCKRCTYFLASRRVPRRVKLYYGQYRGKKVCPFCGKRFGIGGALIHHLLSEHYERIVEIVA